MTALLDFSELGRLYPPPLAILPPPGMLARLAFATATAVQPDILLADEILSVGDTAFQEKCMTRMNHYLNNGTTIILFRHSANDQKKHAKLVFGLSMDGKDDRNSG